PLHNEFGPSLHLLGCGGARLEPDVAWQLEGLGWEVLSGYGLTETAPILTFNPRGRERIGSTGLPLGNVELRIETTSGDEFGEVQARGPNVFAGYWNNPEATSEVFTADNWFRTGDLGYLDEDGYLFLVGRSKELIVLADGKNIFPDEIETVIAESPFILDVAVLEHEGVLVGLIVPDADAVRDRGLARVEALLREQIEFATAGLAPYQRLSGFVLYQDDLPRTHLGKLRRHLLTDIDQGAKAGKRPKAPVAHSDEDLALLASPRAKQVWDWLTALYPDQPLHLDDSPQLDLGIDSLKWLTLTLEMEERFDISINEDAIAQITTLRDFLQQAIAAGVVEAGLEGAGGGVPTLSAEQERWLKPTGPMLTILGWMLYQLLRVIMRRWFRLTVKGIENLPETGPYILAPNHVSYLDSVALMATLPWRQFKHTYWAGWTGLLFRGAITHMFSRMARIFPVDPDRSPGLGLAYGLGTLERRNALVWFPEGRRSPTGELGPFMPGIGMLVGKSQAPVLPVLIEGSFEAMPVGARLPRRYPINIAFGDPLTASALDAAGDGPDQATRIANALHDAVARLEE
ncbi:MAG: 1-acyl-sn-glycerol-3-phosphate acyltransferase, partial [Alphaproteobacteria bacterium]